MKKIYTLMGAFFTALSSYAQVSMDLVSTYRTGIFDDGAAEIVTFDSTSQTLIFSNASTNEIEFLDFSDPANLTSTAVVNLDMYGGGVNSVCILAVSKRKVLNAHFDIVEDNVSLHGRYVWYQNSKPITGIAAR